MSRFVQETVLLIRALAWPMVAIGFAIDRSLVPWYIPAIMAGVLAFHAIDDAILQYGERMRSRMRTRAKDHTDHEENDER